MLGFPRITALDADGEFIATQARHEAGATIQYGKQAARQLLQQLVADVMTEGIVDALESIQIQQQ